MDKLIEEYSDLEKVINFDAPLVSIIVITYNQKKYIKQ